MCAVSLPAAGETAADTAKVSPFTWGAEVGSGIDMGGDDMSTLNIEAQFGYRNSWLNIAGLGAGINVMMSNSCRSFPIYAVFRSSFANKPKLLFGDLKIGVAVNQATGIPDRTNFFIRPSVGINLARGEKFSSYMTLGYTYNSMTFEGDKLDTLVHGLNMATVSIGVTF